MPKSDGKGKIGKGPAKRPPIKKGTGIQKKVKVVKGKIREAWTMEHKMFVCKLRKEKKAQKEIKVLFEKEYGVKPPKHSTLSTWYNEVNMKKIEKWASKNTTLASVETHDNPKQRPTIMLDMEVALLHMIRKSMNNGTSVTQTFLKTMSKSIFNKLRDLDIYDKSGERVRLLRELNEVEVGTLMENASKKKDSICPMCKVNCGAGDNAFMKHVEEAHVPNNNNNNNADDGASGSGDKEFTYDGSGGWLRNFCKRHNLHNVLRQGEMGSNDQQAAKDYVAELRVELVDSGLTPKKVVQILLNIDETGIVYKSLPKRTYKIIGETFKARKSFKDRVTVLVGASMDGFKLKPVVIGKYQNPRAFKNVNREELPVRYYGQESAWMDQNIMRHWFYFYLDDEIKEHYGRDTEVILTIDNAGCHPPELNDLLPNVQVKYLPPNTTALIQPMDQGVIHSFKKNFLSIYYNKMIEYVLLNDEMNDPMAQFTKTYDMLHVVRDIGAAWETVEKTHIHKCFENLLSPEDYVKEYNERYGACEEWDGLNFRGFQVPDNDKIAEERAEKIRQLVSSLHAKLSDRPDERIVTIDCESVIDAVNYDPNDDQENTTELIQQGYHTLREAKGLGLSEAEELGSEENDVDPDFSHNKRQTLQALAKISVTYQTGDFTSKEEAAEVATCVSKLQEIFSKIRVPTASTIATPSTSGVTIFRAKKNPVPIEDHSSEEELADMSIGDMGYFDVALDEEPPASSPAASTAASTASPTPPAQPTSPEPPAPATSPEPPAPALVDESNGSLDGVDEALVELRAKKTKATVAAAANSYLQGDQSTSYEDGEGNEMQVAKFTALHKNKRAKTSKSTLNLQLTSLQTGPTSPGGRSSMPAATSSPATERPRRSTAKRSANRYAELSFDDSDDSDICTTGGGSDYSQPEDEN